MLSKKKIVIFIISVLVISTFLYNQIVSAKKKSLEHNKKRLTELSISREKIFWECHKEQLKFENEKWMGSDEYKNQNIIYQKCLDNAKNNPIEEKSLSGRLTNNLYFLRCKDVEPNNRWNQNNELASKYCSKFADESEDGVLRDKFRKKVPISELTNREINEKIKESN